MRFIRLAAFLSFLSVTGLAYGQVTPKRYALLIGVKQYEATQLNQPPLQYPESDAQAIGDKLRNHGYSVTVLLGEEATRSAIQDKLTDLRFQGNADGVVVVGLFGHGVEFHGSEEAMYCPYDAGVRFVADADGKALFNEAGERQVEPDPATLVSMSDVLDALKLCKAGNKLLLADCCRNDPSAARGRAFGASVKLSDLPDKTACLFACSTGEKAYEHEDWNHGAMTKALLDNFSKLESPDSDILEIAGRMSRSIDSMVRSTTAGQKRQTLNPIVKGIVELKLGTNGLLEFYQEHGYLEELTLYPGQPAPPLPPLKYLEGEPVRKLKRGQVYVLNSFASWCGPCVANAPAMSKLQGMYPQVTIIDIDVESTEDLESFLKKTEGTPIKAEDSDEVKQRKIAFSKWIKGEKGYRFCADTSAIREKGESLEGKFMETWQTPALEDGIPCAFVVDADSKVAWIGHPSKLQAVIEAVVSGKWDSAAAAEQYISGKAVEQIASNLPKSQTESELRTALTILEKAMEHTQDIQEQWRLRSIHITISANVKELKPKLGELYAEAFLALKTDPEMVGEAAWALTSMMEQGTLERDHKLIDIAIHATSSSAQALTGDRRATQYDTVAHLQALKGDIDAAIASSKSALEIASPQGRKELLPYLNQLEELKKKQ